MTGREQRLRERIDVLLEQRGELQDEIECLIADLERAQRRNVKLAARNAELGRAVTQAEKKAESTQVIARVQQQRVYDLTRRLAEHDQRFKQHSGPHTKNSPSRHLSLADATGQTGGA